MKQDLKGRLQMSAIYYRESLTPGEERSAIEASFPGRNSSLLGVFRDSVVIGRYTVLPFYRDIERELALNGCTLINSHNEHLYIANFEWYHDVEDLTPKTWFRLEDVPKDGGPFVLKGCTNSRKHNWNTHMYAENFKEAIAVASRLKTDSLIGEQDVLIREFVKLRVLEEGINGLPFSNEWRFFFLGEEMLANGFYWAISEHTGTLTEKGLRFAHEVASLVAPRVPFFCIDIAETENGDWVLIEVNDGQMSGLSGCDPMDLYSNLTSALNK